VLRALVFDAVWNMDQYSLEGNFVYDFFIILNRNSAYPFDAWEVIARLHHIRK
jgi:hypothetical protein